MAGMGLPAGERLAGGSFDWAGLGRAYLFFLYFSGVLHVLLQVFDDGLARRELIIEFPYTHSQNGRPKSWPHRPREFKILLEGAIRQAMELGWNPNSRGRPFNMVADEDPDDPALPANFK